MLRTTKLSILAIDRTPNPYSVLQIICKSSCPQCALKLITRIHPHFELLLNTSRCLPPPPKFTLFGFKQCDMVSYKLKKPRKILKKTRKKSCFITLIMIVQHKLTQITVIGFDEFCPKIILFYALNYLIANENKSGRFR